MKTMMMPASYNVMNDEEMTYTVGGASTLEAVCAVVVPGYGVFRLISDARAERQKNPDNWVSNLYNSKVADAQQSTTNLIYQLGCAGWTAFSCIGSLGLGAVMALVEIYV